MISLILLGALTAFAQQQPSCSSSASCPEEFPCCSTYGTCGTGAYCLGGCDPRFSFSPQACVPDPVCVNQTYTFSNMDNLISVNDYLGDASQAGWVYSGYPMIYDNSTLMLTMPNQTGGTVISSTSYVWYGSFSAKLKTSRGQGVITAFIAMSDVQDEIDYEFVGADLNTAQTNFYHLGFLNYSNSYNISVDDTFDDWHTYEIDWTEDEVKWIIDGKVGRTLQREDTWNATAGQYDYPQTPSRVQLSIWPGGLATNPQGTIDWAGGEIDWDSPDMQQYGYYYAMIDSISINCYSPPDGTVVNGDKSYIYEGTSWLNNSIEITNDNYILSSQSATGLNMTLGAPSNSTSGNSTSDPNTDPATGQTGPGGFNTGGNANNPSSTGFSQSNGANDDEGAGTRISVSLGVMLLSVFYVFFNY